MPKLKQKIATTIPRLFKSKNVYSMSHSWCIHGVSRLLAKTGWSDFVLYSYFLISQATLIGENEIQRYSFVFLSQANVNKFRFPLKRCHTLSIEIMKVIPWIYVGSLPVNTISCLEFPLPPMVFKFHFCSIRKIDL